MSRELRRELEALHRANGHGSIDGIEFDFRHQDIREGWIPIHSLAFELQTGGIWIYGKGPRVIFPWSSPSQCFAGRKRLMLRRLDLLKDIAKFGPHGWVGPGDKISVATVTAFWVGADFGAEQDGGLFRVRYRVTRAEGRVDRIHGYSIYAHRDSEWAVRTSETGMEGGLDLAAVKRRLNSLLGPGDIGTDGEPSQTCEMNAANCHGAVSACEALSENEVTGGAAYRRKLLAGTLIEAGYYLAKAEAAVWMEPHAERGLAVISAGSLGGRMSGEARRKKAAETLEPHALELAKAKRAESKHIGQDDLAADIQSAWKLNSEPPGFRWLRDFVRRVEADGRLPKRVAKGPSKGVKATD